MHLLFPKALRTPRVPDAPEMVALLDGPVVLAGLRGEERCLHGDQERREALLAPDDEHEWGVCKGGCRAAGQEHGPRFTPLHQVRDEAYALYLPAKEG